MQQIFLTGFVQDYAADQGFSPSRGDRGAYPQISLISCYQHSLHDIPSIPSALHHEHGFPNGTLRFYILRLHCGWMRLVPEILLAGYLVDETMLVSGPATGRSSQQ